VIFPIENYLTGFFFKKYFYIIGLKGFVMNTTKIIKEVSLEEFKEIISKYKDNIVVNPHAFDHLSDAQRKVFKEQNLIDALLKENPRGIGLQRNGRYAAFYRRNWGFLRIILEIKDPKLEITTYKHRNYA